MKVIPMQKIIECEEKFFCEHTPALFYFIEKELGFCFQKKVIETDIYLEDKQSLYIQKNTCLRLRKSGSELLELTSKKILNNDERIKIEKTHFFPLKKEEHLLNLLKRIGIKEYCTVFKERFIYTAKKSSITYNIMIDILNQKSSFLELEIIANRPHEVLKQKLNDFVKLFEQFNLKKTNKNYRDIIKESE